MSAEGAIKADPPPPRVLSVGQPGGRRSEGPARLYLSEREDGAEPFRGLKSSESKRSV